MGGSLFSTSRVEASAGGAGALREQEEFWYTLLTRCTVAIAERRRSGDRNSGGNVEGVTGWQLGIWLHAADPNVTGGLVVVCVYVCVFVLRCVRIISRRDELDGIVAHSEAVRYLRCMYLAYPALLRVISLGASLFGFSR